MSAMELNPPKAKQGEAYMRVMGRLAKSAMSAIADDVSRKILLATVDLPQTVLDVSHTQGIPQSTCYRRMTELVEEGLVVPERIEVTPEGRYVTYRSSFSAYRILSDVTGVSVEVVINEGVAEKVHTRWITMASRIGGVTA